jgi:hypothetical protein
MRLRTIILGGDWKPAEVRELTKILAPLPAAWLERNPHCRSIIRRSVLTDAPPEAPGHSKYEPADGAIVVFDKGVYHGGEIDPEQFRRSVYHELAHSIVRGDPDLLRKWTASTKGDGFIDDYAKTGPEEDFCDTFSEFFIHNDETDKHVPRKAQFIRRLLAQASREKVAMSFLEGFSNELVKTARPSMKSLLSMIGRGARGGASSGMQGAGRIGMGKGLLMAGGAGAGGAAIGAGRGKKKGYAEGTDDVMDVAQRARVIGRREGVMAYHRALMEQRSRSKAGK